MGYLDCILFQKFVMERLERTAKNSKGGMKVMLKFPTYRERELFLKWKTLVTKMGKKIDITQSEYVNGIWETVFCIFYDKYDK